MWLRTNVYWQLGKRFQDEIVPCNKVHRVRHWKETQKKKWWLNREPKIRARVSAVSCRMAATSLDRERKKNLETFLSLIGWLFLSGKKQQFDSQGTGGGLFRHVFFSFFPTLRGWNENMARGVKCRLTDWSDVEKKDEVKQIAVSPKSSGNDDLLVVPPVYWEREPARRDTITDTWPTVAGWTGAPVCSTWTVLCQTPREAEKGGEEKMDEPTDAPTTRETSPSVCVYIHVYLL